MNSTYTRLLFPLTIAVLITSCATYSAYEDQALKFRYPKTMEIKSDKPELTVTLFSDQQNKRELTYFHGISLSGGLDHASIAVTSLTVFLFAVTSDVELNAALATRADVNVAGFAAIEFHGYMDDYVLGRSYFRYVDIFTSDTKYGFQIVGGLPDETEASKTRIQQEIDDVWKAFLNSIQIK